MSTRRYVYPEPIGRDDAAATFGCGDPDASSSALVRAAYHDPDWRWVQYWCIHFALEEEEWAQYIGVLCLAHLARIHHEIDLADVTPLLLALRDASRTTEQARDTIEAALWDFHVYLDRRLLRQSRWRYDRSKRQWLPPETHRWQ